MYFVTRVFHFELVSTCLLDDLTRLVCRADITAQLR